MPVSTTATTTSSLPREMLHASAASTSASGMASSWLPSVLPVLRIVHWSASAGSRGRHRPSLSATGQSAEAVAGPSAAAASTAGTTRDRMRQRRDSTPHERASPDEARDTWVAQGVTWSADRQPAAAAAVDDDAVTERPCQVDPGRLVVADAVSGQFRRADEREHHHLLVVLRGDHLVDVLALGHAHPHADLGVAPGAPVDARRRNDPPRRLSEPVDAHLGQEVADGLGDRVLRVARDVDRAAP